MSARVAAEGADLQGHQDAALKELTSRQQSEETATLELLERRTVEIEDQAIEHREAIGALELQLSTLRESRDEINLRLQDIDAELRQ